jgi:phosphoribosyl 1,2-cyclic phosphodiesterase
MSAYRIRFPGTRAYVDAASDQHRRHSALAIDGPAGRLLIDCGQDWLGRLAELRPDAILLTHAHPDHAFGLQNGAPCPVWATADTWADLKRYPVAAGGTIQARTPVTLMGVRVEAFPVAHSTRCPTVAYRIQAPGGGAVLYASDVVHIPDRQEAFSACALYIGDGTSLTRSLVRKAGGSLVGHAPVRQQLTWCRKAGVPDALFTHNGRPTIQDPDTARATLQELAEARGLRARLSCDGTTVDWPAPPTG